jgi:methyl-accepting chemotaxis protein
MRASLADTAERSERLADDISRSVMALQFQDRMSQQIAHVTEALQAMEQGLSGGRAAAQAPEGTVERRRAEIAQAIEGGYTMDSERAVLCGQAVQPGAGAGDVELF